MNASFAKRLRSGQQQLATIISLPCPEIAEIAAGSGYDWLFIDAEHGPLSVHAVQSILQAAGECPCIVRIPTADPVWIAKALDVGAAGILVPQVSTPEQVRGIVEAAKYPPQGSRGVGVARAQGYGAELMDYLNEANRETLVFIQAEHQDAVDNIDAIAQVPGLDGTGSRAAMTRSLSTLSWSRSPMLRTPASSSHTISWPDPTGLGSIRMWRESTFRTFACAQNEARTPTTGTKVINRKKRFA